MQAFVSLSSLHTVITTVSIEIQFQIKIMRYNKASLISKKHLNFSHQPSFRVYNLMGSKTNILIYRMKSALISIYGQLLGRFNSETSEALHCGHLP